MDGKYQNAGIEFRAPLSEVELFKLSKVLTEWENIFIESIEGKNLDIAL